jgi:hypothetical protein
MFGWLLHDLPDKLKARVYPPLEPCHLLGMHRFGASHFRCGQKKRGPFKSRV